MSPPSCADWYGWGEFRAAWITAVNMWFKRMEEPYTPKKPSVARRRLELFNAFVGAGFKYEELFPQPPPKPEAQKPAEMPAVEVQRLEERGLRREVEKPAAKPEAPKPVAEAVKPEAAGPEVVRSLRRGE